MFTYEPVTVSRGGFAFCRYSVAGALWVGAIARIEWLVAACALVMLASAILSIRRAPLVMLYASTVDRVWSNGQVVVDAAGIRFAQSVAVLAIGIPLAVAHFGGPVAQETAWRVLPLVAVFKTMGALGFCAVSRLYTCAISGGACCAFLKRRSGD